MPTFATITPQSAEQTRKGAPSPKLGAHQAMVVAAGLFTICLWGGTPTATKIAVAELDPFHVGLLRTFLAGLCAVPLLLIGRLALPSTREGKALVGFTALCGFVAFPLVFSYGVSRTSASHAALLLGLLPLFTGLIAAVWERQALKWRWWLGSAIAVAGTLLLVDARLGVSGQESSLAGDLVVALACFLASFGYVSGAHAARHISGWAATLWSVALASLVMLPLAIAGGTWTALTTTGPATWAALFYLSVLSSILGYAAWYWALAQKSIGRTGALQFVQPVVGLACAVLFLGEALSGSLLVATVIILAGVALTQTDKFRRK